MNRGEALLEVGKLINGDRNQTHGEAVDQLTHAKMLKDAVGHHSSQHLMLAEIEAIDMICVKLSRLAKGTPILDHYLDIIGYAAIAVEARSGADKVKPNKFSPLNTIPTKTTIPVAAVGDKS